jgi:XTP/dITP diphosphohydrolase
MSTGESNGRRRLLVATGSKHKMAELRALLDLRQTEILSLADVGLADDANEAGVTFEQNSCAKALWYAARSGLPTLADDSGLEVDALGGRPGVHTRRFAGADPTDEENNGLLLEMLEDVGGDQRGARYRCVLVYAEPKDRGGSIVLEESDGVFEGRIAAAPRGNGGFGYDPIFEPAEEPVGGQTVAQLSAQDKNARSHRGKAARRMRELLIARGY